MARIDPGSPRRPVTRAEDFYTPPPSRPADAWRLVPPAERALAWYEEKQQRRLPRPGGIVLGTQVYAQINHGRWVANCPECPSAQLVTPTDPRLYCVECLSGWFRVLFPDDVAAVEREIGERPVREQNWWHDDDQRAWNRPPTDWREPTAKEQRLVGLPPGTGKEATP